MQDKNRFKIGIVMTGILLAGPAHAADWLMLQGTEPAGSAEMARVWGFIQPDYTSTSGAELKAGPFAGQPAVFNQMAPDLKTDSQFNIRRARIGVRGAGFPLDSNVHYFILAEAGNNGITSNGGGSVKLTDASVTLNHLPGARVRVGQFKYPGAEEGLQAIHVFDYINFTAVTDTLLLERFYDGDGSDAQSANRPNGSVGAFRDVGVQLFDTFKHNDWEHSYAVMAGNGNGIARGDNDDNKDIYLYWSSAKIFSGQGPRRQDWKLFAWTQNGKRTLRDLDQEFDRDRWGVGTTFRKDRYRAAFEYVKADGMIPDGTDGGAVPGSRNNTDTATASFNVATNGKADGWYAHFGYAITPKWELDIRYDILNRVTNVAAAERQFDTWTLGAQYFFNRKTRLIMNYEIRNAEAPNLPGNAVPNQILDGIDNRFAVQVLAVF